MSYLTKQLSRIVEGGYGIEHGALTFTDQRLFKYRIMSGLYNGYPIVTDNLYGTLVTLFSEIQDYIDDLYRDESMDEERRDDMIYDALVLNINNEYIEVEESDLSCDADELHVKGVPIKDICGSNYGSGIYVGE